MGLLLLVWVLLLGLLLNLGLLDLGLLDLGLLLLNLVVVDLRLLDLGLLERIMHGVLGSHKLVLQVVVNDVRVHRLHLNWMRFTHLLLHELLLHQLFYHPDVSLMVHLLSKQAVLLWHHLLQSQFVDVLFVRVLLHASFLQLCLQHGKYRVEVFVLRLQHFLKSFDISLDVLICQLFFLSSLINLDHDKLYCLFIELLLHLELLQLEMQLKVILVRLIGLSELLKLPRPIQVNLSLLLLMVQLLL